MIEPMFPIQTARGNGYIHKDLSDLKMAAYLDCPRMWKDQIELMVCMDNNENWWIVNEHLIHDDKWEPIGPFGDPNSAVIHMKLIADTFI